MIEVEQKYFIADPTEFRSALAVAGYQRQHVKKQIDCYFQHPSRDFSVTDEAFRLRNEGDGWFVSYKGPKKKGPLKQRFELELPIQPITDTRQNWTELLSRLGFQSVATVQKNRETFKSLNQPDLLVVIDELQRDTESQFYCEIEVLTEENETDTAISTIESVATSLKLVEPVTQSYLEIILADYDRKHSFGKAT